MTEPRPLTDKQERFILEYLVDFNATQAAIRAGYSEDTAYSIGWENLRKPEIASRIATAGAQTADELGMTREYVFRTLREAIDKALAGAPKSHGTKDGYTLVYDSDGNPIIEWSPSGVKGLVELLAKVRGDLVDTVQHTGGIEVTVNGVDTSKLQ